MGRFQTLQGLLLAAVLAPWAWYPAAAGAPGIRVPGDLDRQIARILEQHKVPGLSGVIAGRDGILWVAGVGLADVASGRRATADTPFRIGSVSKTFAALAALKLVEAGRLDLQAPVRSLVPGAPFTNPWEATDPVRVVHLLEHTTGWDDSHPRDYASDDPKPLTLGEGLALCRKSRVSRWKPGTCFAYSNPGPAMAAAVVERVTGQQFEDYVGSTLFRPMGMAGATYLPPGDVATLYHRDGTTPYPSAHLSLRPSGAISASARDMGAYLRVLLGRGEVDGKRILDEASIRRMETPTTTWAVQDGLTLGYGLCNYTDQDDQGFVWHGHNGALIGARSQLDYLPGAGVGYFFAMDSGSREALEAISRVFRRVLTQDLPRPALPPVRPVPAQVVRTFTGWYRPFNPKQQLTTFLDRLLGIQRLSFQGDALWIRPLLGPARCLVSVDGLRFREPRHSVAELGLMENGEGRLAVTDGEVLRRGNPLAFLGEGVLVAGFVLALVTTLGSALVGAARWLAGHRRAEPLAPARLCLLLAAVSLGAALLILGLAGEDAVLRLGRPTLWSFGLCAFTWVFAAGSLAALGAVLGVRPRPGRRWAHLNGLGQAVVFALATVYMGYWGILGLRLWR